MELLERFAQGEIDAFETLVRQFQGEIYGWTVRIVRDPGIAEDLTIETLWRAYKARRRFRPNASFGAWTRRIATNLAIDYLRTRHSETELIKEPEARADADLLEHQETRMRIQQAFRRLPAKLQVAATLALIEEQSYDEIADALGTSVGAVKLRVFRAVRILRRQLGHLWNKNQVNEVGR
jgi:RNA polymerase sigma factor (sigma-70 family)